MIDFVGVGTPITEADIAKIAQEIGCSSAVVHAVRDIESGGRGFLSDNRPQILFESHAFHMLTDGQYDNDYPDISTPSWERNYGAGGAHQYDRLEQALQLDYDVALQSASWGAFQIMGENYRVCGYADVESFVKAMVQDEATQLEAFGGFCKGNHLDRYLQSTPPNFAAFARGYNGPGYADNAYDVKLAAAWRKWNSGALVSANPAPRTTPDLHFATLQIGSYGPRVGALQGALMAKGYDVGVDNYFGPGTLAALVNWQKRSGLVPDGVEGPATAASLGLSFP